MSTPFLWRVARAWDDLRGRGAGAPPRRRDSFKGAEMSRLTGDWLAQTRRADDEIKRTLRRLRARARDLSRNSSTVRYFRRLLTTNVIGPYGARLQAQVGGTEAPQKEINGAIERAWVRWAKSKISVDGKLTFVEFQRLALKTVATDGEVFVRKHLGYANAFGFALQLIDADQVDETFHRARATGVNEVRMGVEVDVYGRPVAYHVFEESRSLLTASSVRRRIPASEIVHLYVHERPSQTRGVTWLQTSMFPIKMRDALSENELVASRIASAKMGWFQEREGAIAGELSGSGDGSADGSSTSGGASGVLPMEANPGVVDFVPRGYEFEPWDPQHPTTAFAPFLKFIMRDISSGLGTNYNALANDLEGVNYSSMRSGLLIERDLWMDLQAWWESDFLLPIYAEWLNAALLVGALVLGSMDYRRFLDVSFEPRGWSWVDPLKEIQAYALAIAVGVMSRTQVAAERGDDFAKVAQELASEKALAESLGISIDPPKGGAPTDPASTDDEDAKDKPSGTSKDSEDAARLAELLHSIRSR